MSARTRAILQALFVTFLWATSWVFIKRGLTDIPPILFAGLRYFLAFLVLSTVLMFSDIKKELQALSPKTAWHLILLGLLFYALTQGASFVALAILPAITVNLLWSFSSVIIAIMGFAWLSEKPTILQWSGIGLAVMGACIYFLPVTIPPAQFIGVLVALTGILANGFSSIMGRSINRSGKTPALIVTVVSMGAGSIALLATSQVMEGFRSISLKSWLIIIWLAIVNTAFAFTLWNHTLRSLTAMESSIINGTMLIWIPIFAVIFLGESISGKEISGLIAAGMGTLMVQLRHFPPKKRTGRSDLVP